ncbi:lysoplasmalogenase [Streptomyces sp. NRRL S-495]|uniref:lysoplasmalogenase n=1 Tax=Streptomyces sp. NRRL S-495 TaxID=1609133 RepID=UPI0007C64E47|nr:lysoplasmalogenase [Streptomyces sp. NRRL S-495]
MSIRTTTRAVLGGRLRSAGGLLTGYATTGYATTSAAHLGALLTGTPALRHATKPALMPLLAAHSVTRATEAGRRAPKLLAPALLLSAGGDVLLQLGNDTAFLAGMGSFAAAHVCYVTMFVGQGALTDRRRTMVVAAAYATAWVTMVGRLWPDLGDLRAPVAGYSLLLASTAVASAGLGARGGLGGALFLLSDTLIATKLANHGHVPPGAVPAGERCAAGRRGAGGRGRRFDGGRSTDDRRAEHGSGLGVTATATAATAAAGTTEFATTPP